MKKHIVLICVLLAAGFLMGCRTAPVPHPVPPPVSEPIPARFPSTLTILDDLEAQHNIFLAFAHAHPTKIGDVQFMDNDWTMLVNGVRFFFAQGRFMPENLRHDWERFDPWDFYAYPWVGTTEERLAAFRNPVRSVGSSFLFDTLFFASDINESWDQQVLYSFLGVKMVIHSYIAPFLDMVVDQIRAAAQTDPSVNEWLSELRTTPPSLAWNWRNIAGTNRRSLHSYGIAIDFLPRDLRGRQTYWQWIRGDSFDIENLYKPPAAVVRAFEDHGFLWGGNWNLIDTMHFEYRPEILLLNGFVIEHLNR